MNLIVDGKAKKVMSLNDNEVVIYFKDTATAGNGVKKETIGSKGILNNYISEIIFEYLIANGIDTHFIKRMSEREQRCKKVKIIPLEVIVRNFAAGSIVRRLGFEKGLKFKTPIVEFSYKCDELHDPLLNDEHIVALEVATYEEITYLKKQALKINKLLEELFKKIELCLVDFKLEFGFTNDGLIVLADEISPDNCRLWNDVQESFDKDVFREDKGDLVEAYTKILTLLRGVINE